MYDAQVHNPHDRFFRHVFSDPENAIGELKTILPVEVRAGIEWSSLRLEPGSYVDAELSDLRSDVLFSATLAGRKVLLYLLLEHQSTKHDWMPLKLLGYMVRIWEDYLRQHPDAERLPAILPGVVYHGDSPWTTRLTLGELIDLDPETSRLVAAYLPDFAFRLDDLSSAQAQDLRARSMAALSQLALFCLMRARRTGDLTTELEASWEDRMREVTDAPNGVAAFATVLRYILEASDTPPERVRNLARKLGPRAEEAYMTGAQILQAEAKAEGKAEGKSEGKAEVLLKLLELKFGAPNEATKARVLGAAIDDLDRWNRTRHDGRLARRRTRDLSDAPAAPTRVSRYDPTARNDLPVRAPHSNAVLYGAATRRATRVPPCCAQRRPQRREALFIFRTASAAGASTALGGTAEAEPTRGWATRTGKEEDVEVGLYYFGKRYLNPLLGRWVSADPLSVHGLGSEANVYGYVSGLILKNTDPLGLCGNDGAEGCGGQADSEVAAQSQQPASNSSVPPEDTSYNADRAQKLNGGAEGTGNNGVADPVHEASQTKGVAAVGDGLLVAACFASGACELSRVGMMLGVGGAMGANNDTTNRPDLKGTPGETA